jgi:hypothetical protein
MAYGVVHHFPGGTKEQYEASIAAVHPSDGSLPEGQLFHAAGPSADGWTIIAVGLPRLLGRPASRFTTSRRPRAGVAEVQARVPLSTSTTRSSAPSP